MAPTGKYLLLDVGTTMCSLHSVGRTACSGDGGRNTKKTPRASSYVPCAEALRALVTLQTIFQDAYPAFEQAPPLLAHVRRAARAGMPWRTAALGGPLQACPDGHRARIWYNSCRHRSCPQCAYLQTERWLALQRVRLLACDHYPGIFTVPHDLNPLWLANVPLMTTLLCQAVRATLIELLADPKSLGAQPGSLAALHPWSQTLVLHPPVHCLITGGGLAPDGSRKAGRHGFLLPVLVVMAVCRGKLPAAIRQALARAALVLAEGSGRKRSSTSSPGWGIPGRRSGTCPAGRAMRTGPGWGPIWPATGAAARSSTSGAWPMTGTASPAPVVRALRRP